MTRCASATRCASMDDIHESWKRDHDERKKFKGSASKYEGVGRSVGKSIKRVSYGDIDPVKIARLVGQVCSDGGAVMFSITSDGGAYSLVLFIGDDRKKLYYPTPEALEQAISEILDIVS